MSLRRRILFSISLGMLITVLLAWFPFLHAWARGANWQSSHLQRGYVLAPVGNDAENRPRFWGLSWQDEPLASRVEFAGPMVMEGVPLKVLIDPEEFRRRERLFSSLDDEMAAILGGVPGAHRVFRNPLGGVNLMQCTAGGWPMRALCYERRWDDDSPRPYVYHAGLILRSSDGPPIRYVPSPTYPHPVVLPLWPVWIGFGVDTLCFAPMCFGVLSLGALRRRRRRIKGHCLACGYNRQGIMPELPCPECGHACAAG